ncbi:hypothetical protein ILYODFUR_027210, partial [Ilyodon furcidens]
VQQVSFRRAQTPPTKAVSRSNTILLCNTTVRRAVTSVDSPEHLILTHCHVASHG